MAALVAIILVNWNNEPDTAECLESCLGLDYDDYRIIVVDNGSVDESAGRLRKRFPDAELIETGRNLGFAGGNNVGIMRALELRADYVWLLNNDTVVEPGALKALVQVAERDRTVGMVGSKIKCYDAPVRLWYAGACLDEHAPYRCGHRGLMEEDRGQYDETAETGYVTGCSLLARREMIEKIGLLDEGFFLYFEDTDWNARARAAGWRLMYSSLSTVRHKASASIGGADSPGMKYYLARNILYFVKRNYPDRMARSFMFDLWENVLVSLKKGRFQAARRAVTGIRDFLMNRTGPAPRS